MGRVLIDLYIKVEVHIGSFGEVRRAIHKKTNVTRAVKIIYKDNTDPEERKNLINEINILKKLVMKL